MQQNPYLTQARMAISNLFLSVALYMLYPVLPLWLSAHDGANSSLAGEMTALFGLGIILMGPFYGYLVDHYRRKSVCLWSLIAVGMSSFGFYFLHDIISIAILRLLQGAMFGLAQMALGSTLVIDLSESKRRTAANTAYAWYGRFGLALGPFLGLLLYNTVDFFTVITTSVGLIAVSLILVGSVKVPFRAPLNPPVCSLDRFWMPGAWPVIITIMPLTILGGIILARYYQFSNIFIFGYMMIGFAIALMLQGRIVKHREIDYMTIGMIWLTALVAAFQIYIHEYPEDDFYKLWYPIAGIVAGVSFGLCLASALRMFIDVADHCQRGTANNTFKVCCELGISAGFALCYFLHTDNLSVLCGVEIFLIVFAITIYNVYSRKWYKHKILGK